MMDLILDIAKNNDRVRAVYINGSRANPNVAEDEYRDYDVVFVVTETKWFMENPDWINAFGEIAIVQDPNLNNIAFGSEMHDVTKWYNWLILLKNNQRIDLTIDTVETTLENYGGDSLTLPLLDKDNILRPLPPPTDQHADYYVTKPNEVMYISACNNFWWCLNNVGKGIMREQLPYVMWMYNVVVRDEFNKMIDWYIGTLYDYKVNVGMAGKYYKKYLPENLYTMLAATYSDSDYENVWKSIFTMCDLFHITAMAVAEYCGFEYKQSEEYGIRNYLNSLHSSRNKE
jgi:Streptomycin adenylyltransferase.